MRNLFIIFLLLCCININAQDYKAIGRDTTGRVPAESTNISSIFVSSNFTFTGGNPAAGKVLTSDASGVATWGSAAASSQTPWVTNIDGAFFNLTNVGNLAITNRLFVTGVSGLNNLVVTNSSQLGEVTLNGLTHSSTNAATEGWVSNNFPVIFTNYTLFNFTTNIVAYPVFTNTASSAMFEISCAFFITVIPAATTNTLSFGWKDEANLSNTVNVIDHSVRSSVGSITTAPFTMSVSPSSIVTISLTMDGSTAGYSNNLRVCVKKLQ